MFQQMWDHLQKKVKIILLIYIMDMNFEAGAYFKVK